MAVAAGLAGVCETGAGTVTFWAEKVPEGHPDAGGAAGTLGLDR
ncbi:MAG: hypothetical protein ACLTGJ_01165 [Faecalibacterium prausnitzii]